MLANGSESGSFMCALLSKPILTSTRFCPLHLSHAVPSSYRSRDHRLRDGLLPFLTRLLRLSSRISCRSPFVEDSVGHYLYLVAVVMDDRVVLFWTRMAIILSRACALAESESGQKP